MKLGITFLFTLCLLLASCADRAEPQESKAVADSDREEIIAASKSVQQQYIALLTAHEVEPFGRNSIEVIGKQLLEFYEEILSLNVRFLSQGCFDGDPAIERQMRNVSSLYLGSRLDLFRKKTDSSSDPPPTAPPSK